MYKIQFGSAVDRPSLLIFPSKGDLPFNVVLSADTPSVLVPAITDEMLTARNSNWITIFIVQPGTPETEAALSLYVQPGIPIPPADASIWTSFVPANNWVHNTQPNATPEQYMRKGDMVYVRFSIKNGNSLTIWTLPVGYRPLYIISKMCQVHDQNDNANFGHLQVRPNGDIVLEHPGTLANHSVWADFSFSIT